MQFLVAMSLYRRDYSSALYRAYVEDLVGTLSDEAVAGSAADELHELIDTVVVSWDGDAEHHTLELRGKLLEMLNKTKPALGAGLEANGHSLKLVAGGGIGLWRTFLIVAWGGAGRSGVPQE
ncbi:hypothetical protein [Celeribacter sp.]|uniref:hypothetical protein n=1 Tax=Celeribacter sp. TaxID=1890673 RepID=UPI003A91B1A7